jgi:hypothetical protein
MHVRSHRNLIAAAGLLALSLAPAAGALTYIEIADADLADRAAVIAEVDVLSKGAAPGTALRSMRRW